MSDNKHTLSVPFCISSYHSHVDNGREPWCGEVVLFTEGGSPCQDKDSASGSSAGGAE